MSDYAKITARGLFSRNSDYSDAEQDTRTLQMTLTPDECIHRVLDVYITGENPGGGDGVDVVGADEFNAITAFVVKNNDASNFITITGQELAGTAIFLASKASAFVTGETIRVDGGYAIR